MMRKELVWAGLIGITFGLVVAFGVVRINSSLKKNQVNPTPSASPTSSPTEFKITLDKPENDDVVTDSTVAVTGITKPMAWMSFSGESGDYIVQADAGGVFSQDVDLTSGVNQIKVTAFDPQGNQSIEKVLVVYSSAFQVKTVPTSTPADNATGDANIRANVQAKVSQALNKPKAYIGVVTDIADSTIQIKTTASEIQQIAVAGDGITVINTTGSTTKTVKLTDIAIGDFIVAMGYVNTSSVLSAQRILVTDPINEPAESSSYAKVTNITKKIITIASIKDSQSDTLTPDSKTTIASYSGGKLSTIKLASIGQGDFIIYVASGDSGSQTVRSIFVIQKAQS